MTGTQLLVFARCAGFTFRAPGFSHPDVPQALRGAFAFALAGALASGRTGGPADPAALAFGVVTELAVGAAIGTGASMLYDGAFAGGRTLDDYVGIRASVPSATVAAGAGFGRLWSLAFATGFFTLGGYAVALRAFAEAFTTLPPGALVARGDLATYAFALPVTLLAAALFVAGPAIAIALVTQLVLAVVARVVPRLSTFSLAFGIVYALVLVATLAAVPLVWPAAARPWLDLSPLHAAHERR